MSSLRSLVLPIAKEGRFTAYGSVLRADRHSLQVAIPAVSIGDLCTVYTREGGSIRAEVVRFDEHGVTLSPYDPINGVTPGACVESEGCSPRISHHHAGSGSVLDAFGTPLSGVATKPPRFAESIAAHSLPPCPLSRPPINRQLVTGIRSIDTLTPIGRGQRMVICAPAGAGKSTLIGMITRAAKVDAVVIALVGERGREVREFLEETLGEEGRSRAITVVATSDESAMKRRLASLTATAIAEHLRDQGKDVLLIIDSLTRVARAVREIGLATGEIPIRGGYTPSVYTELPRLLERSGPSPQGSITALYTLLTTSEEDDPLAEEIKSLTDGHLVLSREIARRGIRPSLDVVSSLSRLAHRFTTPAHAQDAALLVKTLARIHRDRDLVMLGGTPDRELATMLARESEIGRFLSQGVDAIADPAEGVRQLRGLVAKLNISPT